MRTRKIAFKIYWPLGRTDIHQSVFWITKGMYHIIGNAEIMSNKFHVQSTVNWLTNQTSNHWTYSNKLQIRSDKTLQIVFWIITRYYITGNAEIVPSKFHVWWIDWQNHHWSTEPSPGQPPPRSIWDLTVQKEP